MLKINAKKDPEEVSQPAKALGLTIKGKRWKLKTSKFDDPLPTKGKVMVTFKGATATAIYSLEREGEGGEGGGGGGKGIHWLPVGNLGQNGFALQLKSKAGKGNDAYYPEGGAITIKDEGETNLSV